MMELRLGSHLVTRDSRPFIIAEVAQTHEGSLGLAHAFIDLAGDSGAHAVKFQTHIASEESTPAEPWRVRFSSQDATRFDYWKRMEFTREQWVELKRHADDRGLVFLSSPFSIRACEWLSEMGMCAWKIASGEVRNAQLLQWVLDSRKPVILSSGLSRPSDSRALIERVAGSGVPLAFLHCTTRYPTPPDEVGLNVLQTLLQEYPDVPIGLSDHSGEVYPGLMAAYLGASIIEVHLTMHRQMFGPDVPSSLIPSQLADLVRGSEFAWRMRKNPVDKDAQLEQLSREQNIFGRSLVAARDIMPGESIVESMLAYKKPGGGLSYENRGSLIGRIARRHLIKDQVLGESDVD